MTLQPATVLVPGLLLRRRRNFVPTSD